MLTEKEKKQHSGTLASPSKYGEKDPSHSRRTAQSLDSFQILQRSLGNHYLQAFSQTVGQPDGLFIQRACACGGSCASCGQQENNQQILQTKLVVGAPDDKYEQEADRVADQVMQMPGGQVRHHPHKDVIQISSLPRQITPILSCSTERTVRYKTDRLPKISRQKDQVSPDFEAKIRSDKNNGTPLPESVRTFFEPRFGHNLSKVRLHPNFSETSHLNAQAFTVGQDIFLAPGRYDPYSTSGRHLLAHELTHTIQQGTVGQNAPTRSSELQAESQELVQCNFLGDLGREIVGELAGEFLTERQQQFLDDLIASVERSPEFMLEIGTEILEAIQEHWPEFLGVTVGLLTVEFIIGILAAIPEPITEIIALILQALVILILGYFAAVEIEGFLTEGQQWVELAMVANGNPERVAEASRAFLRMIRHMILTIFIIAGIRVRVRGVGALARARAARIAAEAGPRATTGGGGTAVGGNVVDISSRPRFRPAPPPSSPPGQPAALAASGGRGTAAPTPATVPEPVPSPLPAPVAPPTSIPRIGPRGASTPVTGTDFTAAIATGTAAATSAAESEDQEGCQECRHLAPDAIPIRWPQPFWSINPLINDPGSYDTYYNMPHERILVKRGSTYYDDSRPEIGRYRTRITRPPYNLSIPSGSPIHHKWPLYLGGDEAVPHEGIINPVDGTISRLNLVVMDPPSHTYWHRLLQEQPWHTCLGPGPGPLTPDGQRFCIINHGEF